jgi:hypothetical protein
VKCPGKFASAYYKLGLEQNIDCKSCHLGDDPVILTAEQLWVKCLISKAELVSGSQAKWGFVKGTKIFG